MNKRYEQRGVVYDDVKKSVDAIIENVGNHIVFAMPLALGKPTRIINELYKRAKEDPDLHLTIVTALALEIPKAKSELERRLLEPLTNRVFEGTPEFEYMLDFRAGKLPHNVEIFEFFNKAGGYLSRPDAQQNHLNSNYTHVVRDAVDFGVNVYGQLLACREENGKKLYSMACNTDISIEAVKEFKKLKAQGRTGLLVAEVNSCMPFMYGDAVVEPETYDIILDSPECGYPLFGPPQDAVTLRDHMIGLYVSTLVRDGGTIQVGIGALGYAIGAGLLMRHTQNEAYNKILNDIGITEKYGSLIEKIGGTNTFEQGLYGSSEMFVDAFMQLYKNGILKRKVYDNIPIMQLVNEGVLKDNNIPDNILDLLWEKGAVHEHFCEADLELFMKYGIFKDGLKLESGHIVDGKDKYVADMYDQKNREALKKLIGKELKNGQVILGAFFLGPRSFYKALNDMSEEERRKFGMSGVETVNQLYGGEELRALQRKDGRFINTGMIVNILGAVTSDQLFDGRVVSGIGGQYNFVAMAHALPDGRLIMMIKTTRGLGKKTASNIVYNYGHTSIPKHLRDIVVTEYGIADLRGKPDKEVIKEILKITDSRFQDKLLRKAKKSGKVPQDYEIPEEYRHNTPEKIEVQLRHLQKEGFFKLFPFGTDIRDDEVALAASLKALAAKGKPAALTGMAKEFIKITPEKAKPFLKRMDLDKPKNFKEKMMQKIVIHALKSAKRI